MSSPSPDPAGSKLLAQGHQMAGGSHTGVLGPRHGVAHSKAGGGSSSTVDTQSPSALSEETSAQGDLQIQLKMDFADLNKRSI